MSLVNYVFSLHDIITRDASVNDVDGALCAILWAICAHGIEIVRDTTTCQGGSNVISPFKAPLGISVKVEIFSDLLPGGWVGGFVLS